MIEKDPGEVQFDQVEWKVQPDSKHEVQPVWYDHMRGLPLSEEATLQSTCTPACRATCLGRAWPLFLRQCKGPSREKLAWVTFPCHAILKAW